MKIKESRNHELYLGAPSFSLKRKRVQFGYLKEKMMKKVESWRHKKFSKAGKEILIKAVLLAVPTYVMSCFRIPTSLCHELEAICANFWWEGSEISMGLHWKKWDALCRKKERKKEEGGLGFKRLIFFNQALIAKQTWRLIDYPNSLAAQLFKARYYRSTDLMQAELGSNPSFVWRSICWGRELSKEGLNWCIANGQDIHAEFRNWFATWAISEKSSCCMQGRRVGHYIYSNGNWQEELVRRDFTHHEAEQILTTRISREQSSDRRYWKFHPTGLYTMSSGYRRRLELFEATENTNNASASNKATEVWINLWKMASPPKIKMFWWQLLWDCIPTEASLAKHHVLRSLFCSICGYSNATTIHVIFQCPYSKDVWRQFNILQPRGRPVEILTVDFIGHVIHLNRECPQETIAAIAWGIWKKRCELLHMDENRVRKTRPLNSQQISWAVTMAEEYKNLIKKSSTDKERNSWGVIRELIAKNMATLLLFTDASFDAITGSSACGIVLLSPDCQLLSFKTISLGILDSTLEAELIAIKMGILEAKQLLSSKIVVCSDSLDAINLIKNKGELRCWGGYTLNTILRELRAFKYCSFIHICRDTNTVAHTLAKQSRTPANLPDWFSIEVTKWALELRSCLLGN